jgi:hypothetical protein
VVEERGIAQWRQASAGEEQAQDAVAVLGSWVP